MAAGDGTTGIRIEGGTVEKQAVDAIAAGIAEVFRAGFETRMEQETVRAAIDLLGRLGTVQGATVSGCHIRQGPDAPSGTGLRRRDCGDAFDTYGDEG